MQVDLGQDVFSSDGKKLGSVRALVVDAGTKEVRRIAVGGGLSGGERLVDLSAIAGTGPDGVRLDLTAAAAESLPRFVREEHVEARHEDAEPFLLPTGGVGGPIFYDNPTAGAGYPGTGSFFDPAPINPPPVEVESNILETEVMIGKGTDVVGADGRKVGTVDEVFTGDRGTVEAFLVKAGFLFKHDVRIPIAWVKEVDDDRVLLTVTAEDAERSGQ